MCIARSLSAPTIVVRILPTQILTPESMAMPAEAIAALAAPNGLIVASGIAGSGKTTVVLSMVDHINATRDGHICTIEDPLTMRLAPKRCIIQQREVGVDVPDVLGGFRAALLQDPDVILLGETRRVEELDACISATETGHLVFLCMYGQTPEDTIRRLIDVQPPNVRDVFQKALARALRMVVTTVLLIPAAGTGRIAAWGVLIPDAPMRDAIAAGTSVLDRAALPPGCQLLEQDVRRLATEGIVTKEEAHRALAAIGKM
jgi:twitching motility protein PilT